MVTYKRLLVYIKPYRVEFFIAILGMAAHGVSVAWFAQTMQPLLDDSFIGKDQQSLVLVPLTIVGIFLLRGVGSFFAEYYMALIGGFVINKIRSEIFNKYLHLPSSRYDHSSSGEMISLISYNVERVSNASTNALTVIVRDSATLIGLLAVLFYQSWTLAISLLVLGPIVMVIVRYVSKRFRRISRNIQTSMGKVSHVIEEAVESQREIKIYGGQAYEQEQFNTINESNRRLQMKMTVTRASSVPIVQLIISLFLAGIVYLFTLDATSEQISPGEFISFITAMVLLFPPLKQLTSVNETLQQGIAAGETAFALLDEKSENDQGTKAIDLPVRSITIENLSFRYSSDKDPVLRGVSLDINAGETIALVGRSGSGKTTLVNLLARMYQHDVAQKDSGVIKINGIDIAELSLKNLRSKIAYVGQDVKLFNDTIAHNIAYGALDSKSFDDIKDAAHAAHAADFIEKQPRGYQTLVGENGVMLSGGQRQRIAIARALLKNAPILILDEATSALDTESERKVQQGLNQLLQGRTTLVVAHRLSTIEHADKIAVMHNGVLVELGRHEQLLAQKGHYAALHAMQFKEAGDGT